MNKETIEKTIELSKEELEIVSGTGFFYDLGAFFGSVAMQMTQFTLPMAAPVTTTIGNKIENFFIL